MAAKSRTYWQQRFKLIEASQNRKGLECYAEIERQYREAQETLEGQISKWYRRLAKNNNVSLAEAHKLLTESELKEFKWTVQDYIAKGKENAVTHQWMKQLENASAKYHISRLEALKLQTQESIEELYNGQQNSLSAAMKDIYESGYYRTAYEIQKGVGVGWDFSKLDERTISKVINKPWAPDGKNFSSRIWSNKEQLVNELNTTLVQNIMLGQDPQKAIDTITKKLNTSKVNAGRLVMTEEAYFSSVATKDCYNELDVEEYEILATLDSHTSDICRSLDGTVYKMSEYEAGVTAPPFHVWCRSTTIPHFDDDFGSVGERAARGEDGKTYNVPGDMTYNEWKEKFVDGVGESDIISGGISGTLDPYSERAQQHADQYYESVRHMKTDCKKIAQNAGYTEDEIQSVKNYIFMEKHDLGRGEQVYFDSSYDMAQSWQRLIDGRNIQEHDITLIKHEIMESEYVKNGMSQDEAHKLTSKKYNYAKEADEYNDKIRAHKKK